MEFTPNEIQLMQSYRKLQEELEQAKKVVIQFEAENARLKEELSTYENRSRIGMALEIKKLQEQLAAAQLDAARYRWLRDEDNWGEDTSETYGSKWAELGELSGSSFDDYIDSAMKGEQP